MATFSDDFNRANENLSASANWEVHPRSAWGDSIVTSNQVGNSNTSPDGNLWTTQPADDQFVQVDATAGPVGLILRDTSTGDSDATFYYGTWNNVEGGRYNIWRTDNNSFDNRAEDTNVGLTARTLRFEAAGGDLTLWADGVNVLDYTDGSPITGGKLGINIGTSTTPRIDNFSAGDLVTTENLILESGDTILLEDGTDVLLLESAVVHEATASGASTTSGSAAVTATTTATASGATTTSGTAAATIPSGTVVQNLRLDPTQGGGDGKTDTSIFLTWDAVAGASGYDIERDGVVVAFDNVGVTYEDSGLSGSTEYTHRVRAVLSAAGGGTFARTLVTRNSDTTTDAASRSISVSGLATGDLLVVVASAHCQSTFSGNSQALTVTDTLGDLTWTTTESAGAMNAQTPHSSASVHYATVGATTSGTVILTTADANGSSIQMEAHKFENWGSVVSADAANVDAHSTGTNTLTLSAAPASGDITLGTIHQPSNNSGVNGSSISGNTELYNSGISNGWIQYVEWQVCDRTGSTATSFDWSVTVLNYNLRMAAITVSET